MNTPDYLRHLGDPVVEVMERLASSIAEDMARRVTKVGLGETTEYQARLLMEAGYLAEDVAAEIAGVVGSGRDSPLYRELEAAFGNAAEQSTKYDNQIYEAAGRNPRPLSDSPNLLRVLRSEVNRTFGEMVNLTRTTALTSQVAFIRACDLAHMQVLSGAMSYTQAIAQAVRSAGGDVYVRYPSGHRDTLEVATRRATLTGVNQAVGQLQVMLAGEMGCDLFEVTAHAGARPTHAEWQGRVYRWNR